MYLMLTLLIDVANILIKLIQWMQTHTVWVVGSYSSSFFYTPELFKRGVNSNRRRQHIYLHKPEYI